MEGTGHIRSELRLGEVVKTKEERRVEVGKMEGQREMPGKEDKDSGFQLSFLKEMASPHFHRDSERWGDPPQATEPAAHRVPRPHLTDVPPAAEQPGRGPQSQGRTGQGSQET